MRAKCSDPSKQLKQTWASKANNLKKNHAEIQFTKEVPVILNFREFGSDQTIFEITSCAANTSTDRAYQANRQSEVKQLEPAKKHKSKESEQASMGK